MFRRFAGFAIALALLAVAAPDAQSQTVHVVKMVDVSATEFKFEPAELTVKPGDVVRWEQTQATPHNVDFRDGPLAGTVSEFLLSPGQTWEITIEGTFGGQTLSYVCTPHEFMGMKGTIIVEAEGATK